MLIMRHRQLHGHVFLQRLRQSKILKWKKKRGLKKMGILH